MNSSTDSIRVLNNPIPIIDQQPMIPTPIQFHAFLPKHLACSPAKKIKTIAYNIFSIAFFPLGICRLIKYRLQLMGGNLILPAQVKPKNTEEIQEGKKYLIDKLKGVEVTIKTPDGLFLEGMHLPGKKGNTYAKSNAPTIIFFNGNWEEYQTSGNHLKADVDQITNSNSSISFLSSSLKDFTNMGYNVFVFNYRGVQNSTGRATRDGLILDGESALQYVNHELGVPLENVILFGHSLGGGIATQVAANNPSVNLCNDRSFSSLKKAAQSPNVEISPLMKFFSTAIIKYLDWDLDSVKVWNKIRGNKWIIYHPEDLTIKKEASLYKGLGGSKNKNLSVLKLKSSTFYQYVQRKIVKKDPSLSSQKDIESKIPGLITQKGLEWNAASAHNRKLLRGEREILTGIFVTKAA